MNTARRLSPLSHILNLKSAALRCGRLQQRKDGIHLLRQCSHLVLQGVGLGAHLLIQSADLGTYFGLEQTHASDDDLRARRVLARDSLIGALERTWSTI